MTGTEIFKRSDVYERDARSIRLHAPQWKLLLAFDADRTLYEIAQDIGMPLDEALELGAKFLQRQWIDEQPITLEQYLKRVGGSLPPSVATAAPSPAAGSSRGVMRLASVVDFIISTAESAALGNLLVYRVFLHVSPTLLQTEEVSSVHLNGDNPVIRTEALQRAVAAAVLEVTKRPLPDGVFAPA